MPEDPSSLKSILAGVYDRAAPAYDQVRYFHHFAQPLVAAAEIFPGAAVLDVACGRGAVLLRAAEAAGPDGQATGVDISAGMLRATRSAAQGSGHSAIRLIRMDAEHLGFHAASFDRLLCSFAMQFFPDLDAALAEFRQVLRPGGVLAVTSWGPNDPAWAWFDTLRERLGGGAKLKSRKIEPPEELAAWLSRSGFTEVNSVLHETDMVLDDEAEWWNTQWSISGRCGLERLSPAALKELEGEVARAMAGMRRPDGLHVRLRANVATGRNP